ncbi:ANT(4')-I family aminoglycoside nucleotidyltransferase [Paenibacillus sp. MZ04-78.2]|uniref:ANT(4')-I family aminoglycoside nucleotidyltransferase n=1 Tax=Paenibacillus sp. MZ04-78.2 TaxID=2962034 RepID=UPI0020B6DD82|nr:ANT(4')-I family aminoglycoside nucleotidyltransferase [Paenibacillus sp. MZ04-78.2]MCP3774448.1 ANT(4')-I family aminoglycoside nucleotidyltransferase [Paenibacillus sp. MZ04-78.2]
MNGPQAVTKDERRAIGHNIADRLKQVYGDKIKAIGLYGSMARGTDGPYSDIEMLCVLRTEDGEEPIDFSHEWAAGAWKAEVNVYSEEELLKYAKTVEDSWPLSHGAFLTALPLYDPDGFFDDLIAAVQSPDEADFRESIHGILVGEMFEFAGKWRNANAQGPRTYLPYLAMETAQYAAMLIGLHHRTTYSTGAKVIPEAMTLPDRPEGFDALAQLVLSGELSDPDRVFLTCEAFWNGLQAWAEERDYGFTTEQIPF